MDTLRRMPRLLHQQVAEIIYTNNRRQLLSPFGVNYYDFGIGVQPILVVQIEQVCHIPGLNDLDYALHFVKHISEKWFVTHVRQIGAMLKISGLD